MTDAAQPASEPMILAPFVPEPLPPSSFADPLQARRAVPLAIPVVSEGRTWSTIFVRRFSVDQVATVIRNWTEARKRDADAPLAFPSFVDSDGIEVPRAVMGLLDDDDMQEVQKAGRAFLPRRFRPDPDLETETSSASGPDTGDTTAASSTA